MKRIEELILYRLENHSLPERLSLLAGELNEREAESRDVDIYSGCMQELVETAESHGFSGNLWHCYLTYLLVYHENAYSRACEIRGAVSGGINGMALQDFEIFREWFSFDFQSLEEKLGVKIWPMIRDYANAENDRKIFNRRIRDRIRGLSRNLAGAVSSD